MKRLIVSLASMMALSACVSFLPEPEAPGALYRLGPVDGAQSIAFKGSVLVRQPEAPRIFSGIDIAARDGDDALRLVKGVKWADRAPRMFQMTLLDFLGTNEGGFAILPETGARADYELSWRLSEFVLAGRTGIARAELTLLDGKTRKPLKQLTVSSQKEAKSNTGGARAEALAEAGRDVARQAAQFVAEASAPQN